MLTVRLTLLDPLNKNSIRERKDIFDNKILLHLHNKLLYYRYKNIGGRCEDITVSQLTLLLLKYQLKNEIYTG